MENLYTEQKVINDQKLHDSLEKIFQERCHGNKDQIKKFLRNCQHHTYQDTVIKSTLKKLPSKDFRKLSLLWVTVLLDYYKSAELLVHSGADINELFGNRMPDIYVEDLTILHRLFESERSPASLENERLIRLIIDHDADLQALDQDEQTILHYAVRGGRVEITEMMLKKGADCDINAADKNGVTPLLIATTRSQANELVPLLIKYGADVNMADNKSLTPLLAAASNGKADELVPLLMEHGADIFAKDHHGKNVLHHLTCAPVEHANLARILIDKGVPVEHENPLIQHQLIHLAAKHGKNEMTATKVETHSCRHATKPANREKNQNQKCIPYDYNRVVLETINGRADSDYINASYVDSILKPNAYIVTQGPMENTVVEFWRMVWQERAACIVMLTKTFDFIKVMCMQYWPASKDKDEDYGGIGVSVLAEEELANFHIRTIKLYKKDEKDEVTEERTILQFHYTEWHSHTCPFGNAVLEFRRRVRAVVGSTLKSEAGPMVVHCNDGGGRSGVYLAIDANMELAEEEDAFDVFGYLKKLRQSRKGLIENLEQYKFVYDTLEEFVICGASWFPVSELSVRLKQKSQKNPITKMNEYQREYQQICKQTPRFTIGDCAGGHRADNREKNRDVLVVPPDNFRPYLTSFQGNTFTDYINAVFVDGYTKPREYIVTEWPVTRSLGEFWSLVYDYECAAVVVLCVPPAGSTNYPSFWPEGRHSKKYGPVFTIDHISHNHYTNIKTWVFRINKKIVSLTELMAGVKAPPKTVQLFQLTCWPMGQAVPTSTNSLVELMNMVERWRQRTDYGPVAVVSPDGRSRCGVYCAANACIEQVIQHGEVDIFQAVKTVRRHRPQLVENMTEYKYCYDLVLHYVLHYLNKDMNEKK